MSYYNTWGEKILKLEKKINNSLNEISSSSIYRVYQNIIWVTVGAISHKEMYTIFSYNSM